MPRNTKSKIYITAETRSGVAYIRLVDAIREYGDASSAAVRLQVDSFINQGVTKAEVYINGKGGDCFEATEIANELERFGKDNVSIEVGAVAASAYTYLISKFKTKARANSQFMIHKPSLGTYGNVTEIENDLTLLKNTEASYKTAYAAKTGKTEDEIETIWSKGDVWMTAQQALDMKLIDEIIDDEESEITAEDRTILEACGAPVIPPVTTKEKIMDRKLMIAALGLDADATDEQIIEAAEKAKLALDAQVAKEETEDDKKKAAAKKMVAKYVKLKHIKADVAEQYETFAFHDLEGCETALKAMTPIPQLSAELKGAAGLDSATITARAGWTFDDWQEKDPAGLEALHDSDEEKFTELFNAQYKR